MGFPLEPSISVFYISHVEKQLKKKKKPKILVCYVDDSFIATLFYDEIKLKPTFEKNALL